MLRPPHASAPIDPDVPAYPVVDGGGRASDASLLDYFAAAALQASISSTPAQLFDKAAAMVAESKRRKGHK